MVKLSTSPPAISVPAPENMGEALKTLNALANEQRLLILCLLSQGSEMTVTELNKDLDLSQSALSQHLKKLKDQGYVVSRKEGLNVFYRIGKDDVLQMLELLHKLYC